MKKLAILCVFIASVVRAQEAPTAESILQEMEQTYAGLRSYSDTTTVDFRGPDGGPGPHVDFKIWLSRPKFVRLDASTRQKEGGPAFREVMWCDGDDARSWSSAKPVVTREKIQLAGSKVFGSYAYHVPTLLEASYGGVKRIHQLESPSLLEDEAVEGVDCHHVKGAFQGDPYELWIGKDDHLVRKLVANYKGYLMEETHRDIVTNQPMDMRVFHFAPEEEVAAPGKKATPPPRLPGEHRRP